MLDSLVRVSRRVADNHYANIRAEARSSVPRGRMTPWSISLPVGRYIPRAFDRPSEPMLAWTRRNSPAKRLGEPPSSSLVASASLSTISHTVYLSFQSAFHLSITLLVRYRSLANI